MLRQIQGLDPRVIWSGLLMLALIAAITLGAVVLQRARRDLLGDEEPAADVADTLREAFEAGELSEEEYRKVRESLGDGGGKPPQIPRF